MVRQWMLSASSVLVLTACLHQVAPGTKLAGEVRDYATREPVAKAIVRVTGSGVEPNQAVTDAAGHFTLSDVGEEVKLEIRSANHETLLRSLYLTAGEERIVDFFLVTAGTRLPDETILFERGERIWIVDPAGNTPKNLTADLAGTQVSPTWNGDHSQFAFIQRLPGRTQILTRYADGTPARFVTNAPDSSSQLRWAPDSRQLIYTYATHSPDRGQWTELKWLDAITGMQRDLIAGAEERDPAWSPDSRWVAWSRRFPGRAWELWLANAQGGLAKPLLVGYNAIEPSWSPDGKRMVFASNWEKEWNLYEIAVEAPRPRRLTSFSAKSWARRPSYGPLGNTVLFESNDQRGNSAESTALYTLNLRTGRTYEIIEDGRSAVW